MLVLILATALFLLSSHLRRVTILLTFLYLSQTTMVLQNHRVHSHYPHLLFLATPTTRTWAFFQQPQQSLLIRSHRANAIPIIDVVLLSLRAMSRQSLWASLSQLFLLRPRKMVSISEKRILFVVVLSGLSKASRTLPSIRSRFLISLQPIWRR